MVGTVSEATSPSIEDLLGRGRVEMWRYYCPVGKVGVFRYGDFSNVDDAYTVSVGDKAWQRVKNQAIEVLKDWRNAAEEEPYYYINPDEIERDIRKLMSMPE